MRSFTRLIPIVIFVFLLRLVLSFLPSFQVDMGTWLAWAQRLTSLGPAEFYSDTVWTQYTPGFFYWLLFIGKIGWINELAIKIPVILADLATGGLIWLILRKVDKKLANLSFFIYVLNPAIIFNGSVWGQIDGILTLFLFLSIFFLVERKNSFLSFLFWGLSFLIKPQAIAIFPVLFVISAKEFPIRKVVFGILISLLIILLLFLPFFPKNLIFGPLDLIRKMAGYYSYTSLFAFNFWSLVGMWKPDNSTFLGISFFNWGVLLLITSLAGTFIKFRNSLGDKKTGYLIATLASFSLFLFPTRVHERYLFPVFSFLLVYAGLTKSKLLLTLYGFVSFLHIINLYYPYSYYEKTTNFLKIDELQSLTGNLAPFIAIGLLLSFFVFMFWEELNLDRYFEILAKNLRRSESNKPTFPEISLSKNSKRLFLGGIFLFSLISRVAWLGIPKNEYFDEVYHAFTARRILHNDPKAWEWWNTPPPGFAYEWTHPPLAKLGMVLGMKIFGENSFGWRFPQTLLGTGTVFLIYLIAKKIFKNELTGIISSAVFALDGLPLVMSRIGMNEAYFLFFVLLSIYLFLEDKLLFSAFVFGLALSSKWSSIWTIPIFLLAHFVFKKKIKIGYLWFLVVPVLVYLVSYLPMFLSGHGLDIFWGMQKQMWWYHTGLKATHAYSSSWWSWPTLLRPVWLFTEGVGNSVRNIYAMGNPVIFWFGLASVVLCFIYSYLEKNKNLAFVIFSYLIFFVPWAASPRIMFFYHYLPSVAFLAIATGYILRRFPKAIFYFLVPSAFLFLYFYPHWTGLSVPLWLDKSYYWFSSWR